MMHRKVQLTIIQCEKLQNIVGLGTTAPYHVTLSEGETLGLMGQISEPGYSTASNQPLAAGSPSAKRPWLRRALATLGISKI